MKHIVMGILAHVDAGKTTLTEALLYKSGAIERLGRVDSGDAFLDTYEVEKERGITVFAKQAQLEWDDLSVTLVDTPGHVDFSAEAERVLRILDYAVLVINAADGVQSHTRTVWRLLAEYKVPVFIFVNKMDREHADRSEIARELQTGLDGGCLDFEAEDLYEELSLCGEELLDEYLETEAVSAASIARAVADRSVFPCVYGSALKLDGVEKLMRLIAATVSEPRRPEEFGARIFKISRDRGERLTLMKITGGSLKVRAPLVGNAQNGEPWSGKVNSIRIYSGSRYKTLEEARAGTVCAVSGLDKTFAGEGLGFESEGPKPMLEPVVSYGITLPSGCNEQELYEGLKQIGEENPELGISRSAEGIFARVMGEVQTDILKRLAKERLGADIELGRGKIVYKETIADAVYGIGHFEPLRHYAEVHLLIEPGESGSGITAASDCSEDELEGSWQRLILTHIKEREHRGVLTGAPLTDVKITLVAGKAHLKHTEGGDFRQAVYRAVRQGLMQAKSVLLEPVYEFALCVPSESTGRAINDIQRMGGHFNTPVSDAQMTVISGTAPVSEMYEYNREVAAYSHGLGSLSLSLAGYAPCHNEAEIIEAFAYKPEGDTENTPDSVFCAHGAGFVVPWNEVREHMHLPARSFFSSSEDRERERQGADMLSRLDEALGVEEIDEIIARLGGANRSAGQTRQGALYGRRNKSAPPAVRAFKPKPCREKYILVDGYNVIFAWEELETLAKSSIDGARGRLLDLMCGYRAAADAELIVVFDAYRVKGHDTEFLDYHNIHVVYTREAQTADSYIERFAHENGARYDITVVTSDGLEQIIIRGEGCALISSREFENTVREACGRLLKEYGEQRADGSGRNYLGEYMPK
ncbi:MAG: TetM/TetW/TetO/TetS family tetracycline resistance ribosomal protection protein [Butyrivibrio sp.]|nr:TetM/TetW/TetO/TetS family tetracycline resistance ribosomal protection protein [Butyrivibrio sp.]